MQQSNTTPANIKVAGPYSPAKIFEAFVFTSGQIPTDETGNVVAGEIAEQTHKAIANLKTVLECSGSDLEHVLKTACFLQSMEDFSEFNEVYAHYFPQRPARSCFAVRQLPKGALCEIEAIAVRREEE